MTYIVDGHPVDQATFLADEDAFECGHNSYIRPVYDNRGNHIGFAVYVSGEAVGKVHPKYKSAFLLLEQIRAEHVLLAQIDREERRAA